MSKIQSPFNFKSWIDDNRHLLRPPVGNQQVFKESDFIIMVVGGPNSRTDYHINEGDEFFFQLEGDMNLRILENGKPRDIPIREGEIFMLPGSVPHSPQRGADTVGLVIEHTRGPDEKDGFLWICDECHEPLYKEFVHVSDIVKQLPEVFDHFYGDASNRKCKKCGAVHPDRVKK